MRLSDFRRVVAVVGCQRSGTTLTGQLLGAQAGALLLDEPDGVYPWLREGGRDPPLGRELLVRAVAKHGGPVAPVRIDGDRVVLAEEVDTLVLKVPNLTFEEARLAALAAPVTVVYPHRDPRAVAASMARLAHIDFVGAQVRLLQAQPPEIRAAHAAELEIMADPGRSPWARRAAVWRAKSGRADAFRRAGLAVFAFAYERLATAPEPAFAALCEACGYGVDRRRLDVQGALRGIGPDGSARARALDTASLERWRDELDDAEAHEVMAAAAPLAQALRYG